jgi:hypothetical protein
MIRQVYVFSAHLEGDQGVRRTIAVRSDQTLVDLHHGLQMAFGWDDDHLYSFWLGGKFRARDGTEYTHPFALESDRVAGRKSSEQRLDRLRLTRGKRIAYLFDFGDEWRVLLGLRTVTADDGGRYPRLLESVGEAPPQYPDEQDAA